MTEMERFADLFGLTVEATAERLATPEGRRTLGLTESAPIELQIRLLLGKNLGQ